MRVKSFEGEVQHEEADDCCSFDAELEQLELEDQSDIKERAAWEDEWQRIVDAADTLAWSVLYLPPAASHHRGLMAASVYVGRSVMIYPTFKSSCCLSCRPSSPTIREVRLPMPMATRMTC